MNEIIKAANFPMQPNKSQTLAGKSLLLFLNYGEGATVENPKWGLVGGQRNSPLSMSGDEIDGSDKQAAAGVKACKGLKAGVLSRKAFIK